MNRLPQIDPEFHACIRKLTPQEYAGLERQLLEDGCQDALRVWNGVLVDGHNRLEICARHKVPFKTVEWEFRSREEALRWIRQTHQGRRNLFAIDLIEIAERDVAPVAEKQAKENQQTNLPCKGEHGFQSGSANIGKTINVRTVCATAAGVSHGTYDKGRAILEAAKRGEVSQEMIDQLRSRKLTINRVFAELVKDRKKRSRAAQRRQASDRLITDERIIVGDFRQLSDRVPDGSVALIFTDPPYDRRSEELFPALASLAAAKLSEGGSLLTYVGHLQLPEMFRAFEGKLRHWWTCACVHSGSGALMREYGVRVGWKPILWFVKGTRDDPSNIVEDTVSGGREKTDHDWQQAQSEAAYWIDKLCPKDGIVCDPFLGSGTTAIAADKLKRRWVGFEKDAQTAAVAARRIQGMHD